jgi:hypothetical protein
VDGPQEHAAGAAPNCRGTHSTACEWPTIAGDTTKGELIERLGLSVR